MTDLASRNSRNEEPGAPKPLDVVRPLRLLGTAGSPGIAIGPAVLVGRGHAPVLRRTIGEEEREGEWARFIDAVARAQESIRVVAERLKAGEGAAAEASILEAYVAMLGDEMVKEGVRVRIFVKRKNVEWAVHSAIDEICARLADGDDPYLLERRHDVSFVGERLLRALAGTEEQLPLPTLRRPSILLAPDLSPADTATLAKESVLALVTEGGTRTSHTSIMARALSIPAVVGVAEAFSLVDSGETVIVDGFRGEVTVAPTEAMIAAAELRKLRHAAFLEGLRGDRGCPTRTLDGTTAHLRANAELPDEVSAAVEQGAEGVGLYRTELLYVDRVEPPSEEEQFEAYRAIVEAASPHPVVLRTFDIGGDKFAPPLASPREPNPALGLRAIRLALSRPELFLEQLRAMVRAAAFGDLRILLPMITTLPELRASRLLLERAVREVRERGQGHGERIPLGIMVEVPSVAVMADAFAAEADFLSLGTNDLAQYTLAVDRSSRSLAHLVSPFEPALLRLIAKVVEAARSREKPLSICGAMASEPLAAVLLLGLGLRDLSMETAALLEVKAALLRVRLDEAESLAREALSKSTAAEVEELLRQALSEKLGDLLVGGAASASSADGRV